MKKIVIMGEPHHGNLGDQAIFMAEKSILKKYLPDYEIYQVHEEFLTLCIKKVKEHISDDDIIMLHGGGNFGDTYDRPEYGRREVIKAFPNNKIIMFPQTAYFSDTEKGQKELNASKEIYNNHKHLVLLARENKSYNFVKENFKNATVYLTPDIVMTLKRASSKKREGALLLFRVDKEKVLEDKAQEKIKQILKEKIGSYKLSDMNLDSNIPELREEMIKKYSKNHIFNLDNEIEITNITDKNRDMVLEDKFEEFQSAKLVVTDRLHGMIFAAITETPCIVFSSLDHKIKESYNWLKDLGYIKYCENINDFEKYVEELLNIKNISYDNSFAEEKIAKILKEEIERKN